MSKLTANFDSSELACACCGVCNMSPEFMALLQKLRDAYGPMRITSGYRCEKRNTQIGGSLGSKHMQGIAADVYAPKGADKFKLVALAIEFGFSGIGIAGSFVHLDTRTGQRIVWTYG